ncbi:MAG: arginine--tRNA ligase [Alphaproteobacteria bacterium]|nr:arginine--tRNA ligase [Alphaproteobacteria bacterium]
MNLFEQLRQDVLEAIAKRQEAGDLPAELVTDRVTAEPPRDESHGDAATNAALVLAKPAKMAPMAIAEMLAADLAGLDKVAGVDVAKPGFVNLRLDPDVWRRQVRLTLEAGADYGRADLGEGEAINVEYCSANPTGPLHIGHARGTVFGDALANLLDKMGYAVTREYYINDGGIQIDHLAQSVYYRYLEALGEAPPETPDGMYPGSYLIPLGEKIAADDKERWLHAAEADWMPVFRSRAMAAMMTVIQGDLDALGVHHDVFTSEAAMVSEGKIDEAFALLEDMGLIYEGTLPPPKGKPVDDWEPVSLLLFKSTDYGDDIDRPLRSSSGELTYFGKDLAYHFDKYRRGARQLIDILGADHGGYVKRMQAAVRALSKGDGSLDVRLCQLVNLLDGGKPIKMSKRAGRIVTLRDVVDEVGKGVVRFIMLTRKNDAPLDFDLVEVTEKSRDNPVFYVQYAHARIRSVQRKAEEMGLAIDRAALEGADLDLLSDPAELALIRQLAQYPRILASAAAHREPHRIAFYLGDLAASFHALWNQGKEQAELRFLLPDAIPTSMARLALIGAVRIVIASGLDIIGVEPVEEMT